MADFPVGSLVRARNRQWVVVPSFDEKVLRVRPLGGVAEEECGISPELETIEHDSFSLPDPRLVGDARTSNLLRNAVRLGMRSTTGPFRSFAKISVEPRSYQFVPLLMALSKETVRLLIADDVGIGKTIEALLIARELLDRGEISRFCVLSPAHLCDQWVQELHDKFHIDAVAVQPGTVAKLERQCKAGQSLFHLYPVTVVSIDYIKSDRRRHEFLQACPELVIVDEAHTCARSGRGAQQYRYRLLKDLSTDESRHMLFVTATPHSGIAEAFRSLLGLVRPELEFLPEDLSGKENEKSRRQLAEFLVQRKRGDIKDFLDEHTLFPDPEEKELSYQLTPVYRQFLDKILDFIFETLRDESAPEDFKQKVRWWAALGLLRCVVSSPAAGAAALRTKAMGLTSATEEEVETLGRSLVLDGDPGDEEAFDSDVIPGADISEDDADDSDRLRNRLQRLAKEAEKLAGPNNDHKLKFALEEIAKLVKDGFSPIVFCRYIHTAEYVGQYLNKALNKAEVAVVTGKLHASDRRERVALLGEHDKRVLVATDCLSEGINLQEHFDAVFHYDLSWNPTRHEQRNGRVDRYGQPKPLVRSICYYGQDTMIDGAVLRVLIRKHREIKKSLGVSVPVPMDTKSVMDAMVEAIFLNRSEGRQQLLFDDLLRESEKSLHTEWEKSRDRETRSRTMFAQETLNSHIESVSRELAAVRTSLGTTQDIEAFIRDGVRAIGGVVSDKATGIVHLDLNELPVAARQSIGLAGTLDVRFGAAANSKAINLIRTHPFVQGLSAYIAERTLSEHSKPVATRCGVMQTDRVTTRTTLLLLRSRFHLVTTQDKQEVSRELLEECGMLAFESAPENAKWLDDPAFLEALLNAVPTGNVPGPQQERFIERVVAGYEKIRPVVEERVQKRSEQVLATHKRVRASLERRRFKHAITPELPVDVLGIYVYLPTEVR